jgi:hypothetical protein
MGEKIMTRNQTLLRAMDRGAKIVANDAPYANWEVEYAPRHKRDGQPWRLATIRYSSEEVRAVTFAEHVECNSTGCDGCDQIGHTVHEYDLSKTRKLGATQVEILSCLAESRFAHQWYPGSGWVWGNASTTERIMKTLEARGLVYSVPRVDSKPDQKTYRLAIDAKEARAIVAAERRDQRPQNGRK